MNNFEISIRDVSHLTPVEVREIRQRLSWSLEDALPDSMQPEINKRHGVGVSGPHPPIIMAVVYYNGYLVAWVATRPWFEKFKGELVPVQTIECFTDPELRQRGFAQLGLQALLSAGHINRKKPVSVYHKSVMTIAERCGFNCIILCNSREYDDETLGE